MATTKAERLLDLVIALLNAPRFRTASWIRDHVAGYDDAASDEAFSRMFERDKQELRDLGIPIQTPGPGADGYRILPGEFVLPEMSFTPAEAAALALAGRLWETTLLGEAGSAALRKIREATEPAPQTRPVQRARTVHPSVGTDTARAFTPMDGEQRDDPTLSVLQARVRTAEPAFADLYAAVRARRAVRFEYRKAPGAPVQTRQLEPWGLVSYHGSWYVVGHDRDRDDARTFRLSRVVGAVTMIGPAGAVQVPEGVDLGKHLAGTTEEPTDRSALLHIRPGAAAGLRRGADLLSIAATDDGFDEVRVPLDSFWDVARRIVEQGPDVVVIDPPDLREAVIGLLSAARRAVLV